MARRLSIALLLLLTFNCGAIAQTERLEHALDNGLKSDEAYAYALIKESSTLSKEQALDNLKKAVLLASDSPAIYLAMSKASLPDMFKAMDYLIAAVHAYQRNFWWGLSLNGLLFVSLSLSFLISLLAVSLIRFPKAVKLFAHEINEDRRKLILPAALILLGFQSPIFFMAGAMTISGLYLTRWGKASVYLFFIPLIFYPYINGQAEIYFSSSTPEARAIASVNQSMDNDFALQALKDSTAPEARFSYALALKRTGRYQEAIEAYKSVLARGFDDRVYLNLGNAYFALDMADSSKESYKRAMSMGKNPVLLFNMSQAYRATLDFENGDKFYDEAVRLGSDAVSRLNKISVRRPNRFVFDQTLTKDEMFRYIASNSRGSFRLSHIPPAAMSVLGVLLALAFAAMDKFMPNRAYKCLECGKIMCPLCSGGRRTGHRCDECHRLYTQDTSPQARVSRLLKANEKKDKLRNLIRGLSFGPPGIAHVFAGKPFAGALYLWASLFCVFTVVLNPLFDTGLAGYSHGWLWPFAVLLFVIVYIASIINVFRKVERGWL